MKVEPELTVLIHKLRHNRLLAAAALLLSIHFSATPAWALSEIQREDLPPAEDGASADVAPQTPESTAPENAAPTTPAEDVPQTPEPEEQAPQDTAPDQNDDSAANEPLPEIQYDVSKLPEPVQRMRQLLIDAAKTGDIEKLRPLIGTGSSATQLSLTDLTDDPITFLKNQSGDPEGEEILAILEEVLSAGFVHLDEGTPEELYVWPYFFAYPLDKLTPAQKVEMYKIVTSGDYYEMISVGYIFYRVGISPEGQLAFFVAGE